MDAAKRQGTRKPNTHYDLLLFCVLKMYKIISVISLTHFNFLSKVIGS